jgi:hypothetical protein
MDRKALLGVSLRIAAGGGIAARPGGRLRVACMRSITALTRASWIGLCG